MAGQIIIPQAINQLILSLIYYSLLEPRVKILPQSVSDRDYYRYSDFVVVFWLSSGDPKAIPWTQLAPIRSAADGWAAIDVQAGDVYCWPTNLGWVMGPTILYQCFLLGATLALYHGSPQDRNFGKFVQVNPPNQTFYLVKFNLIFFIVLIIF